MFSFICTAWILKKDMNIEWGQFGKRKETSRSGDHDKRQ
jgi:hypothetical protein